MVERVDGPVTGRRGVLEATLDADADRRLGDRLRGVALLLDDHAIRVELEVGFVPAERALHQELERRLRALELEPLVLERLELVEDPPRVRRVAVDVDTVLARLPEDVRLARELGHEHAPTVAYRRGFDVLVRLRVLEHGGHVHAALVGEGGVADVGLRGPRLAVGQLGDEPRDVPQLVQVRFRDAVQPHLEDQARDDRDQVRVPAPLAVAVHRALHLPHALADGGQRVGDRALGVVVDVDAKRRLHVRLDGLDDRDEVPRERAAIRVAEHEPVGAGGFGGPERRERVFAVPPEAVEEMLGVEHHLLRTRTEKGDRVGDHLQVFVERRRERVGHLEVPRLTDDRRDGRARVQERLHVGVRLGGAARTAGHAERRELRVLERHVLHPAEEAQVLGIGARPAPLDVVDAERVEP